MSIFGALYSAVSGLSAESSAMGAISDNITNLNTTGYKDTSINFSTLVTQQTSNTSYSSGGVESLPQQNVSVQGLLQATTSSTDVALSGNGFFVVNSTSQPASDGGSFYYTRAGSFQPDQNGYLENAQGYYLMGWPLTPTDNSAAAAPTQETIDGTTYMKAYTNADGTTHYINQNVIDPTELQALNINDIGGTTQATSNVALSINLPASDPVYSPTNSTAGGLYDSNVALYDTLGDTENTSFNWTKIGNSAWNLGVTPPTGAAEVNTYNQATDGTSTVYGAQGQLEFNSVPPAGSYFTLTDTTPGGTVTNVQIQFYNSSMGGTNGLDPTSDTLTTGANPHYTLGVNLNGVNTTSELATAIQTAIQTAANSPSTKGTYNIAPALLGGMADGASRFTANNSVLNIVQEPGADQIGVNVQSNSTTNLGNSIVESNAGIGSASSPSTVGIFTIPTIDSAYQQIDDGQQSNSFTVSSSLATDPTTTSVMQVGTTQIPWSQVLTGSLHSYNSFDPTSGVTTSPTVGPKTLTYTAGTTGSDSLTITDANAASLGTSTDVLDINGLEIPWSTLVNGGTISSLTTDATQEASAGTLTLASPITLTAAASNAGGVASIAGGDSGADEGMGAGTAYNLQQVISSLAGDLNAGGYIGSLSVSNTAGSTAVSFGSASQVTNISFDAAAGTPAVAGSVGLASTNVHAGTVEKLGTTLSAANAAQNMTDAITYLVSLGTSNPLPTGFTASNNVGSGIVALSSGTSPVSVVPSSVLGTTTWSDTTDGENAEVMGQTGVYSPTTGAAIAFNGDGTPSTIIPNAMGITWANGSQDQYGTSGTDSHKSEITLNLGSPNESNGMTQLSGGYQVYSINQNGAQFGTYSGLSIGTDGVVTALFSNGVRAPVFQIPVATFPNPDGLASNTGNVWNATSDSGGYTLRSADSAGAGTVNQSTLEASTVDLATEFTNMIVVQQAYSAASKIVTTADTLMTNLLQAVQ